MFSGHIKVLGGPHLALGPAVAQAWFKPGNTEQGKCLMTNEYQFFLFLIDHWYYEKNILYF